MDRIVGQYVPEEVALLSLLYDVPEKAAENVPSVDIRSNDQGKRVLTFERERDIVDNLAFLSATEEDPNRVTAVCIEELQGGSGLKVILSVNKGDLATVKNGFDRLFLTLKDVSLAGGLSKENDVIKTNLLMEIVSLNHDRLLCRLRSKHSESLLRKRDKPPLDAAITHILRLTSDRGIATDPLVIDSVMECRRFQSLFRHLDAAKASRLHDLLIDIVKCAHELTTRLQLERLLRLLPHCQDFLPQARESLLSRMQKVGRYQSTCDFLFAAARRTKLFKNVQVKVIKLAAPRITKPQPHEQAPKLTAALERGGLNDIVTRQSLCQAIGRKERKRMLTYPQAEEMFEWRVQDVQSAERIHAEIQIIYHYENNPPLIRPRVICSSKSACFLCNIFARTHGKFHIERTHGRLYKKWRLPTTNFLKVPRSAQGALLAVLRAFDDELKKKIQFILQQPNRPIFQYPNESIFVHPPAWTPSNVSQVANNELATNELVAIEPAIMAASSAGSSTPTPTLELLEKPGTPRGESSELTKEKEFQIKSYHHSDISVAFHEHLVKGERIYRALSRSGQDLYFESPSFHISARPMIPDITELGRIRSGENAEIGSLEIEWLSVQEAARIRSEEVSIVDVESMEGGTEVTTSRGSPMTSDGLYMSFNREMVYVRYIAELARAEG